MSSVTYRGWGNSLRLANDEVELFIPGEIGPNIIHFGFIGGENEFFVNPAWAGKRGSDEWVLYGGHRLWHAPESAPRTYQPENTPVSFSEAGAFTRVTGPVESATRIQKEIDIHLDPGENRVTLIHRLINHNLWDIQCAPWGVTMMAGGGTAIIPLPLRGPHDDNLLPTGSIALWAYTSMDDPRFHWGERYILVDHDPARPSPQKIGAFVPGGWVAYARGENLFVTYFSVDPALTYPDRNSPVDVYVDGSVLEVETLGPLEILPAGGAVEWTIIWELHRGARVPRSDQDVIENLLPLIKPWRDD